ncbi:MAG: hypothetical protein JWM96_209 [Alphaproteobacteria bacterium]|nr:hypothetical protein [Alphaproteobacteria bacterium]
MMGQEGYRNMIEEIIEKIDARSRILRLEAIRAFGTPGTYILDDKIKQAISQDGGRSISYAGLLAKEEHKDNTAMIVEKKDAHSFCISPSTSPFSKS